MFLNYCETQYLYKMTLENIIDNQMSIKSITKKVLTLGLAGSLFFGGNPQQSVQNNNGINSATQYFQMQSANAAEMGPLEKQGYHPLYDVLLKSAENEKMSKFNKKQLQEAIIDLAHQNYKAAAYTLLSEYNPYDMHMSIVSKKMQNPGGNNATYWIALKLAAEGMGNPMLYNASFLRTNARDPPLPTDKNVLEFAANIRPHRSTWVLANWSEEVKKKRLDLFKEKILNSNLHKF